MVRTTFEAIGTVWDVRIFDPLENISWVELSRQIQERIQVFDKAYSRFRSDSLITQMSKYAGAYSLPGDGFELLHFYELLYEATEGKVTPLIGQAMVDAGYDAAYSFEHHQMQAPPKWEDVLTYDHGTITVKQPVLLDFGAAGKGYLVDIISDLIEAAGVRAYLINAGGDIMQRSEGGKGVTVALENPQNTSEAIGTLELTNRSLCASAGSKRAWGDYTHIIDPATLLSPRNILASWVLADDTLTADGVATALFFSDPEVLQKDFKFSYALLNADMSLNYAPDFPVTVFEASS